MKANVERYLKAVILKDQLKRETKSYLSRLWLADGVCRLEESEGYFDLHKQYGHALVNAALAYQSLTADERYAVLDIHGSDYIIKPLEVHDVE